MLVSYCVVNCVATVGQVGFDESQQRVVENTSDEANDDDQVTHVFAST